MKKLGAKVMLLHKCDKFSFLIFLKNSRKIVKLALMNFGRCNFDY